MATESTDQWHISDAWLLAAISRARPDPASGGASLAEVLIVAEGINHATPTRDETELALRCLLGTGLIAVDAAYHFRVTEAGEQVLLRWRHGQFGWIDALPPALRRIGPPQRAEWSLPPGAYDEAVEQARLRYQAIRTRHTAT